jgi:hypothetical protein
MDILKDALGDGYGARYNGLKAHYYQTGKLVRLL